MADLSAWCALPFINVPLAFELVAGASEGTLDAFDGFAGGGGHGLGVPVFPVAPEEEDAVRLFEGGEDGPDAILGDLAIEEGGEVGCAGWFGGVFVELELTEAGAVVVLDFVAGDAEEPCLDARVAAKPVELEPGFEESLLKEVFDEIVAGHEPSGEVAVEGAAEAGDKFGGGLAVLVEDGGEEFGFAWL
jgi:hypothetical protein